MLHRSRAFGITEGSVPNSQIAPGHRSGHHAKHPGDKHMQLRALALGLVVSASLLQAAPATAQAAYPSRPVTLVVPQAAGGTNDIVGRLVGQKLGEVINASVVVDNRPGAGGNIGTQRIVKSSGAAVD